MKAKNIVGICIAVVFVVALLIIFVGLSKDDSARVIDATKTENKTENGSVADETSAESSTKKSIWPFGGEPLPVVEVKRPDQPNVLKYITEEELKKEKEVRKVQDYILEDGVYNYAVENHNVKLNIMFYENVTKKEALNVIKKYHAEVLYSDYLYNMLAISIQEQFFWNLSKETEIKFISLIDPPPATQLDESTEAISVDYVQNTY